MERIMIVAALAAMAVSSAAVFADDAHMRKVGTTGAAQAAGQMSDG